MSEAMRLQDPDEALVHTFTWDDWLAEGDAIATSSWDISPEGPTLTELSPPFVGEVSQIKISGLTLGQIYQVTNTVTTSESDEEGVKSFQLRGWRG